MEQLLHEARLILVGQQREDRRDLVHQHAVPSPERHLHVDPPVAARPLAGNRRVRVHRRAAAAARFLAQRLVVSLGRREGVRAHDRCARIVAIAITPRRRPRRIVADRVLAEAAGAVLLLDRQPAVAAEVARVAPELAVLIEILGGEEIDRQRLDPVRRGAVPGRADLEGCAGLAADREPERSDDRIRAELVAERGHIRRRIRQLRRDRRAAPGAHEVRRGRRFARRLPRRARTRSRSLRWPASNGSPPFVAAAARGIMPRDAERKRNRAEAGRRCPGGSATRRGPGAGRRGRVRRALGGGPMGHANLSRDLGRVRRAHRRRVRNGDLPTASPSRSCPPSWPRTSAIPAARSIRCSYARATRAP